MTLFQNKYLEEINCGKGYSCEVTLDPSELDHLRAMIKNQALNLIKKESPQYIDFFENLKLENYHQHLSKIDHKKFMTKFNRIFSEKDKNFIKTLPFYKKLLTFFGEFHIANEEKKHDEEIYWRFVRPMESSDIGPLHADKWFWDLGHGDMPQGFYRLKVWVPIFCESGGNGLQVVPHSQLKDYPYKGEVRGGFTKPVFDPSKHDLVLEKLPSVPGQSVVFHDKLLHGGCYNKGTKSRVSMEFTMLLKEIK